MHNQWPEKAIIVIAKQNMKRTQVKNIQLNNVSTKPPLLEQGSFVDRYPSIKDLPKVSNHRLVNVASVGVNLKTRMSKRTVVSKNTKKKSP